MVFIVVSVVFSRVFQGIPGNARGVSRGTYEISEAYQKISGVFQVSRGFQVVSDLLLKRP